ncbi:flagella basal body P-ring formation protein FlgA [Geobacter metallireducens RCH3]|uniref:Flagella basal body P-ring formation protein FlgA n=1 Tax=Geobacter metallireducens (strain ATCC 53774 / DSM 7210 / GS-15) TaxID=269799 RepID=Q39YJ9_GEOMG|nr:flagellar basal body P-ring formation chaperone FlgA [Geobacter metallireducens]ABB30675.1 flagellar basal body P-ring formation protein FlgA [Geobacter metallireducens GS-15]EHP88062.1 flagella basal body P-ring formation protein FlgA [Geobacter metallireducens RCH3]
MRLAAVIAVLVLVVGTAAFAAPAFQTISNARVKAAIAEFVRQKTDGLGMETTLKRIGFQGDLKVPVGEVSFEVAAPNRWEGWGKANLAVIVRVNDRVERNISVPVEVEALGDTVVVLRALERGDVIGAADVTVQRRDLSTLTGRVYRSADEVIGKRARMPVRANMPLRGDQLEKVPLVKSGQLVTILVENQAMRLTATGKARGNGAEGDIVMVQNLGSLKEVPARVIDAGTVQVDF